jgi:hypothetical protein
MSAPQHSWQVPPQHLSRAVAQSSVPLGSLTEPQLPNEQVADRQIPRSGQSPALQHSPQPAAQQSSPTPQPVFEQLPVAPQTSVVHTAPSSQGPTPCPGVLSQLPEFAHAHDASHVWRWVPQSLQLTSWLTPTAQTPSPVQLPQPGQLQRALQVRCWLPQFPQFWFATVPGAHTPSPPQAPQFPQAHAALHVRDLLPQSPQPSDSTAPEVHTPSPPQAP